MSADARRPSGWRALLAVAGVALAPLAFRLALVAEATAGPAPVDLRGATADLATSLLVLALLTALGRALGTLVALVWVALQYANFENVRALGALASAHDAAFLTDPTFLLGSALAISRPLLLAVTLALTPVLLWSGLRGASARRAAAALGAGLALLGLHALWPEAERAPTWRQNHFLAYNGERWLAAELRREEILPAYPDPPSAMLDRVPGLAADLSGEPIVPLAGRAHNVLLLVLESVSGAYVPFLAEDQGRFGSALVMANLDAAARAHLSFSSFVTHQRKTNRGLYALLCGELPNLVPGLPKMSDFVERGWRTCLPELLRDAGYHTVYLQAAPLAFMMKDQFMPKIGFDESLGHEWFTHHYARSKWGIDDRAFLEQSLGMVDRLATGGRPWFLTLLTVGTHHPYVIPADFPGEARSGAVRALAYLDAALGPFLAGLRERGVLDDTLVLITSDESLGLPLPDNPVMKALSQNWGLLVALLPDPVSRRVHEPFAQIDVPLSILDYLGLGERGRHLFGRSVFRHYDSGRHVFFANTNLLSAGALLPDGDLLLCLDDYRRCNRYRLPNGSLFGPGRVPVGWDGERDAILRDLARRSLRVEPDDAGPRVFELLVDPTFVVDSPTDQLVHGGQYVDLREGEWIDVEIEVEAHGTGRADLYHLLWASRPPPLFQTRVALADGERLRLHYAFAPRRSLTGVRCRTLASRGKTGDVELRFSRAVMRMHTGERPPGPGVQVLESEVRRIRSAAAGGDPVP